MVFLIGGILENEDFFLKSSSRGFIFLCQASSGNPQKILFTITFLVLTKGILGVLLNQQSEENFLFSKGVVDGERPLEVPLYKLEFSS